MSVDWSRVVDIAVVMTVLAACVVALCLGVAYSLPSLAEVIR